MQCPRCGHENAGSRAYCERCGTPLNGTEGTSVQVEYKVPPPPPLNGHKVLPLQLPHPPLSPPPRLEDDEVTPTLLAHPESIARPRVGVFSGILYFIGTVIAIFGLLGALTTPGSGTVTGLIGLLLALVVLILSIVFFVRLRRRARPLPSLKRRVERAANGHLCAEMPVPRRRIAPVRPCSDEPGAEVLKASHPWPRPPHLSTLVVPMATLPGEWMKHHPTGETGPGRSLP